MGTGWIKARNLWDKTVTTATGTIYNVSNMDAKWYAMKNSLEKKGYEPNALTFMQRCIYMIANISNTEHELRDLIGLAYGYYLKEIILASTDNEFLNIDFYLMSLAFMASFDKYVGKKGRVGEFNKKRLAGISGKTTKAVMDKDGTYITVDDPKRGVFEVGGTVTRKLFGKEIVVEEKWEGIFQKVRDNETFNKIKHKDLLAKFEQINNQIKRVIMNTYSDTITGMYESYYTRCDSPEKRGDEVEKQLFETPALQASFKRLFTTMINEDQYFSVFKHMFIPKGRLV